jgi:ABC-2 type transport system ATP-binding protein
VGIAQAIVHNPAVIILDEPTVGLDPIQIREIRDLIRELGADHGIILSTHILSEVQESCTHVQIMHQGRLLLNASINDLNRQMNAATLDIVTREPLNVVLLRTIPGIVSIEPLDSTSIRVHHQADCATAVTEQLTTTIVNAGWGLQSLTPSQYSLEDAFIRLTQTDAKSL